VSAAEVAEVGRPLSAAETKDLFSDLTSAPALVLAVSGGPDSTALLFVAARWRASRKHGPKLLAVTVDHGLRKESAAEARAVARLAKKLGVPHRTLHWSGVKPKSGLQEKARAMRYRQLAEAAAKAGASHVLTAHTIDDQAETVLMRLLRGSGPAGLAGMARETKIAGHFSSPLPSGERSTAKRSGEGVPAIERVRTPSPQPSPPRGEGAGLSAPQIQIRLVRPFLDVPKPRLIATLRHAKIPFADDPSNRDPRFTRVRMRELLPALAGEGLDAKRLALLARRLRRAEAALESAVDKASELFTQPWSADHPIVLQARHFAALPAEVALRLLGRAVTSAGNEGPVELAKLEALLAAFTAKMPAGARFRRTLAGAMVTLTPEMLTIERAPARRRNTLTTPRPAGNKAGRGR
jgi:tRNA(Ile)-lysidine synthase